MARTDLKVLGGLDPVVALLVLHEVPLRASGHSVVGGEGEGGRRQPTERDLIRAAAAHVIGTAASNNAKFQQQLLEAHPSIFYHLVATSLDPVEEVAVKGVYAMAAMVRNLPFMHDAFIASGTYGPMAELLLTHL